MDNSLKKLYEECKKLNMEETLQLILEAENPEEKEFYSVVSDFMIQQRQKKVVEEGKY